MNSNVVFRHYCGIEYHGLTSQEVERILDVTKGNTLKDFYLSLVSEWSHDDATGKRTGRKETYTLRINCNEHYTGVNIEDMATWQSEKAVALEEIVRLIEEHTA